MAISSSRPRIVDLIAWALLAIALLFAVYVRVRLREFPLERDEGDAYLGQLILHDIPPYKLAYNIPRRDRPGLFRHDGGLWPDYGGHPPGTAGRRPATIVLLFRFARKLFDPLSAGMAAVSYAFLSASPSVLGLAAHATHFVTFFGLAGCRLCALAAPAIGPMVQVFAAGLLLGIAFLMKQQGVFLMIFGGAAIAAVYGCRVGQFVSPVAISPRDKCCAWP